MLGQRRRRSPNIGPAGGHCPEELQENTWHSYNAGIMLSQHRRRWPDISQALGHYDLLSGKHTIKTKYLCT